MLLKEIVINGFRNLLHIRINADRGMNILIGDNGQGKTNFLEAIYFLIFGYSFRSSDQQVLINYGGENFKIEGIYQIEDRIIRSSISYDRIKGKKFLLNEKKATQAEQELKTVLFTPDDLYLVKGAPKLRREMIDNGLKQISKEYGLRLENYTKLLKKRNYFLNAGQSDTKIFAALNQTFIEQGAKVVLARMKYIQFLDEVLRDIFPAIDYGANPIKVKYALSFPLDNDKINEEILYRKIEEQLAAKNETEKKRRMTLTGPHLDDLHIYLGGKTARQYCSQGQQRSIVIALKLAQIICAEKIKGTFPIFLLDEVLSELDEQKRKALLTYLEKAPFQSFLTAVNTDYVKTVKQAGFTYIKEGVIVRKE